MLELSQLLHTRLQRLSRTLSRLEHGEVTALHRARIAVRRLRELLPVLQVDAPRARRLGRRLRKLTARLGKVRELDVLLLLVDELHVARRPHGVALSRVGTTVSSQRDRARKRLFARSTVDELQKISRRFGRIAEQLHEEEQAAPAGTRAWRWAIEARAALRGSRLSEAIERAGAVYLPDRLHDVRIALKKLRYVLELAAEVVGDKAMPDLRVMKRAQDVLGKMHDRQVLIERVREEQASLTPPNLATWRALDALVVTLEDDCRRLHARYMRLRPELVAVTEKLNPARRAHPVPQSRSRQVG